MSFTLPGPDIQDLNGQRMIASYTGTFTIALPTIAGTISDTNGLPIPDVMLQASGSSRAATTDQDGSYALGFVPGTNIKLRLNSAMFVKTLSSRAGSTLEPRIALVTRIPFCIREIREIRG